MHDKEQITKLTRELERLRVTTQQLENRTRRLESENQALSNHIRTLEADTAAPQASQPRAHRVGGAASASRSQLVQEGTDQ